MADVNINVPSTDSNAYKSLLYWRKNLWLGTSCVPVILTLEQNTLAMKRSDETIVFSESLDNVTVKFSGWGTMTLIILGKKYDIVGMPAATSPAISDRQKAELSGLNTNNPVTDVQDRQPVVLGSTVASTTGSAGSALVGAAVSTVAYYRGLTSIREWKGLIGAPQDQGKKMNSMTRFIILLLIGLIGAVMAREFYA